MNKIIVIYNNLNPISTKLNELAKYKAGTARIIEFITIDIISAFSCNS